jgi:hypothetical protein
MNRRLAYRLIGSLIGRRLGRWLRDIWLLVSSSFLVDLAEASGHSMEDCATHCKLWPGGENVEGLAVVVVGTVQVEGIEFCPMSRGKCGFQD